MDHNTTTSYIISWINDNAFSLSKFEVIEDI